MPSVPSHLQEGGIMTMTLEIHAGEIPTTELVGHEVRVDGHRIGTLGSEEYTTFAIPAGFHIVELRLGVKSCTPIRVQGRVGQTVHLVVHQEHPGAAGLIAGGWYSLAVR